MKTSHHMCLDISGALRVPLKEFRSQWKGCVRDNDGKSLTPDEFRKYLQLQQSKGHKLESMSSECVGFDPFEKGCPGHIVYEWTQA